MSSNQPTERDSKLLEPIEDADQLIATYIEPDPLRRGRSEMQITGVGVPVWALIGYLPVVDGDIDQVADDYDLPRDAVLAAVAYYQRNHAVIDARIEANNPGDE